MVKGGLILLGGLAAVGLVLSVIKPVLFVAAIAGLSYLGFKVFGSGRKSLPGQDAKALASGSKNDIDFSRRMAELEKLDKQLDRELKG